MLFLQAKSALIMENVKQKSCFFKISMIAAFATMMLIVESILIFLIFGRDFTGLNAQIAMIAMQNVLIFIVPVFLLAQVVKKTEERAVAETMWIKKSPSFKSIALVVLVYIVALPAMNWLVDWNNSLHLPQSLQEIESALREMEDSAQGVTTDLLTTKTWGGMVMRLLLVGVLTGMGEEIFFRSGLLGTMHYSLVGRHVSVWTVAFIFSAIHMQFFGFVPRMLMGAWFGYVMLWSGEVWTPIIAHTLNNGMVVLFTFLANNHYISENSLDTLGVPATGSMPWLAIGSVVATAVVILLFMRKKKIVAS